MLEISFLLILGIALDFLTCVVACYSLNNMVWERRTEKLIFERQLDGIIIQKGEHLNISINANVDISRCPHPV